MRRPGPKSPAGTSFWRARFFSAIPHSFFSFPLFTMLLLCYLLLFSPNLSYRGISTLLPSSAPSLLETVMSATATTPPRAPAVIIRTWVNSPDKYAFFGVCFSSDGRPGGCPKRVSYRWCVDINRPELFRSSPPSEIRNERSIVPSLWRNLFRRKLQGFRNLARGAYFSRIDVERRITSKSIMGRGIERCASSLLGVVIHSTFQRPCSIGNCGKDERHTTAVLSRRRASCNQSYFQRSTFPNPSSRREGTRMYIFKSPDKCIE